MQKQKLQMAHDRVEEVSDLSSLALVPLPMGWYVAFLHLTQLSELSSPLISSALDLFNGALSEHADRHNAQRVVAVSAISSILANTMREMILWLYT